MRCQRGFTLIELVLSMTLLALLAASAVPFVSNGVMAYHAMDSSLQTVDKLRYTSERLVRELREIRRNGSGDFDIVTPVNSSGSAISFFKSDGTGVRIGSAAPVLNLAYDTLASDTDFVLTDELSSITFSYYQADGLSAASDNSDVAFIEFELQLVNSASYHQRSRVALRN